MSDRIPFEIQEEIIKRLPIKSLIQSRSVSKRWKSLIDSSKFIADYHLRLRHTQPQNQIVSYTHSFQQKYVSIVDDDTFPQQKVALDVPMSVKLLDKPRILGISQGLFCFYSYNGMPNDSGTKIAVIWNPAIRKSVDIHVPKVDCPYTTVFGFGVSPLTNDPKIVKITYNCSQDIRRVICIPWQVEVYALSSRIWRTPSINLPSNSTVLTRSQVEIDGCLYWLATDENNVDSESEEYNLIISFDLTIEKFTQVHLPDYLAHVDDVNLLISKLNASLVVLETDIWAEKQDYCVWMMEHGVPNTFTKLFNIRAPHASVEYVLGFRKSGEAIIDIPNEFDDITVLYVSEPYSEHINHVGIFAKRHSFFVSSYLETLLLLDH